MLLPLNLTIRPVLIHKTANAQEIIKDFPDGLDYMITGWNRCITGCADPKTNITINLKFLGRGLSGY
jgi:hypothetical protein